MSTQANEFPSRTRRVVAHWYASKLLLVALVVVIAFAVKRIWFTDTTSPSWALSAQTCQERDYRSNRAGACLDWADHLLAGDESAARDIALAEVAYSLASRASGGEESEMWRALATNVDFREGPGIPQVIRLLEVMCSDEKLPDTRRGLACHKVARYQAQIPRSANAALLRFKSYAMGYSALACQLGIKEACQGGRPPLAPRSDVPCVIEVDFPDSCSSPDNAGLSAAWGHATGH